MYYLSSPTQIATIMIILGLDLGTNSIGGALVDIKNHKVLWMGSRIFPEGVVNIGEGEGRETSKNASRTEARGTRRQFYRRRLRKRYLLRALAQHNLCPIDYKLVKEWNSKKVFENDNLKTWFQLNPYQLRKKALTEKISLEELGRIFYHLIQRRGFLSNSRSAGADVKETSAIFKGDIKKGKIGIRKTLDNIENTTLGSYLSSIYPTDNEPYSGEKERIRNRYTTRKMYIDEFEAIWENQEKHHSELTEELKTLFGGRKKDGYKEDGILFHQRPLRSQKHLVGNCSFEPKKTKCRLSAIPFELFRVYQWINTVSYDINGEPQKITEEERQKIVDLLLSKEKIKFKEIRKALGKLDGFYQFNYKDDDAIVGTHTISNLSNKKFFGKDWFSFSEKEQEDIWHILTFFDDSDKLKEYAIKNWSFSEEKATKISKFNLKDGYASLSRKAINNILPFLKLGFKYDTAVALGGVRNLLGSNWKTYEEVVLDHVPDIVKKRKRGGYINELKLFLTTQCGASEKQLLKLYHHSSSISKTEILDKLPVNADADKEIQKIKNPVVITALFEIRKLVNEIIDEYGKPDRIHIELARSLKSSKKTRYEIRNEQQRLEKENDRVKKELEKLGQRITHANLLKYKLWEECNKTCPYTGKPIKVSQLFTGEIQIEHIYPWSRSLNDSFMNKTLCYAEENNKKGNLTPFEFYSKQGEIKWEEIKLQALSCFRNKAGYPNAYNKFKQFVRKKFDDDFVSRQLNDTRYISKEAKNYLAKICDDIVVLSGQATAKLRHHWGLNTILNTEDDEKTRDDHRHHAIDALTIACTERGFIQELSKWNRYYRNHELKDFAQPWQEFRVDAEKAVKRILVSHKKQKSLLTIRKHTVEKEGKSYTNTGVSARGQLHHQTVYGKNKECGKDEFVYRVKIEDLSFLQLINIIDKNLKQNVINIIKSNLEDDDKIIFDKMVLKEKRLEKSKVKKTKNEISRILKETSFYMPNKGKRYRKIGKQEAENFERKPIPIKKVRVKKVIGKAERLKNNIKQYVDPQNNHHVLIYKDEKNNLKEEVVTFWTAVERKRTGDAIFKLPEDGKKIVTTLQINDMFLLGLADEDVDWENPNNELLRKHLYRVQKFTSGDYYFRKHIESKLDGKLGEAYQYIKGFGSGKTGWKTFNPIKVKISVTGKINKVN